MAQVGRKKKKNAMKPGELKSNLCRFTFIADIKQVAQIKAMSRTSGVSVKDLMNEMIKLFASQQFQFKKYLKQKLTLD